MPGEDTEPQSGDNVAPAEPSPEQVSDILPKDSQEPVPAAEEKPGDEPEGEPSGPEDEGDKETEKPNVRDKLLEQLRAIGEEDPDLIKEVLPEEERERLQKELPDTSELARREAELVQRERQAKRAETEQAYQAQVMSLRQSVGAALQAAQDEIARQAETGTEVTPNWNPVATAVDQLQRQSVAATWNYLQSLHEDEVTKVLTSHSSSRHLTDQDRQKIADAKPENRIEAMIRIQLDAAEQRGASEAAREKARKEAEETLGLAERLEKVTSLLGNGAGKRAEASSPPTQKDESALLADPNTPIQTVMEIRERQKRAAE